MTKDRCVSNFFNEVLPRHQIDVVKMVQKMSTSLCKNYTINSNFRRRGEMFYVKETIRCCLFLFSFLIRHNLDEMRLKTGNPYTRIQNCNDIYLANFNSTAQIEKRNDKSRNYILHFRS